MKALNQILQDEEIVANLQQDRHTEATLRYLYRNHTGPLAHYILANRGSAADAEDIFQDVLVAFIRLVKENRFRGEATVKTLLYALNRNLWLNELKKRERAAAREARWEDGEIEAAYAPAIELREASRQLQELLAGLGDNCKKILLLFYFEKRSIREILTELPYENEQVVRNKKGKCLKKLDELIRSQPALAQHLKTLLHD